MKQQQATMKRLFFFAAAAAALASCSETDELALSQAQQQAKGNEVSFSVYTNRATRAGAAGEMTTTALQGENAGFGIFAYHTNNSFYDEQNSEPNFMYNQQVKWSGSEATGWTYDPVKYWPNEFGDNAKSNDIDYVTFFAYAPFVDFDPATGSAPVAEGDDAEQEQWKNITGASRNGDNGDPFVRYWVDTNPSTSVDLLWGVAGKVPNGLADSKAPESQRTKLNGPFLNLSKQVGVADKLEWKFYHSLAKLNVQIIAANDIATEGSTAYTPAAEPKAVDDATKIYLRWIEFNGFAMNGALNLNSPSTVARWFGYDGATDLKGGTVRFNDGLLDDKEGIADNVNPNERVLGKLNPALIEKPTAIATADKDVIAQWKAKQAGIPTDKYVNLFDGATAEKQSFFVIPTGEPLKISMLYDIMTADKRLSKYLSDGVTPGSHVSNEITKDLNMKIYAGKAYDIKIVVGVESIKVTAEVNEDWGNPNASDVDMPYNPNGGEGGSGTTTVNVDGVTISAETTTLAIDGTTTLTANVTPAEATNKTVKWSSDNIAVATVNENTGEVTAVAAGEANITATATNGTADVTTDDKTATIKITVTSGARPTMGTMGARTGYSVPTTGTGSWF